MNIASQVSRLVDDHRTLVRACRELTAERDALRAENRVLQQLVREQKSELSRLRLSEGLGGGAADREQARARVNRLLREVDRCIALLNRQNEQEND